MRRTGPSCLLVGTEDRAATRKALSFPENVQHKLTREPSGLMLAVLPRETALCAHSSCRRGSSVPLSQQLHAGGAQRLCAGGGTPVSPEVQWSAASAPTRWPSSRDPEWRSQTPETNTSCFRFCEPSGDADLQTQRWTHGWPRPRAGMELNGNRM